MAAKTLRRMAHLVDHLILEPFAGTVASEITALVAMRFTVGVNERRHISGNTSRHTAVIKHCRREQFH